MSFKILFVEDDETLLNLYSDYLQDEGMNVVRACDGEEALNLLHREKFDLLITDVRMPKMSGIELLRQVKEIQPDLPSVIVSGLSTVKEAAEAVNLKVYHFLEKPIRQLDNLKRVSLEAIRANQINNKTFKRVLIDTYQKPRFGLLATGIAHNINSPLGGVMGYTQLAQMKNPSIKGLDLISDQATKVSHLLSMVADKGHSENNRTAVKVDLRYLIEKEIQYLNFNLFFKHNVELKMDMEQISGIIGVYSHFSQIFNHLLQNAVDAMYYSQKRVLSISLKQKDDNIVLTFIDTGEGIPAENLDKVFLPGFSTRPLPDEVEDAELPCGYGMGLYVIEEILKDYGGAIKIDSTVDEGTTVEVTLPLKRN